METKTVTKCERCDDTGSYPAPNGQDDSEMVFCSCEVGVQLENPVRKLIVQDMSDDSNGRIDFLLGTDKCWYCKAPCEKYASGCSKCHRSFCD